MATIYREADADLLTLTERRVALLGAGELARGLALNLRDAGLPLVVGCTPDQVTPFRVENFEVMPLLEAAKQADIIWLALPDESVAESYTQAISPALRPGMTLVFNSGYALTFGFIEPPSFVDCVLIAPRIPAFRIRDSYLNRAGFPALVAVEQDATGYAWPITLALTKAIGGLRVGALETTFRQEAELRLFTRQTVWPLLMFALSSAQELLVQDGYPPEMVLLELSLGGELAEWLQMGAEVGSVNLPSTESLTGQYSILSRLERLSDPKTRRQMELIMDDIRAGKFAHEWASEYAAGYPRLDSLRRRRQTLAWEALEQQAIRTWRDRPVTPDEDLLS
jgi:ketol-acid reductoisomerase